MSSLYRAPVVNTRFIDYRAYFKLVGHVNKKKRKNDTEGGVVERETFDNADDKDNEKAIIIMEKNK